MFFLRTTESKATSTHICRNKRTLYCNGSISDLAPLFVVGCNEIHVLDIYLHQNTNQFVAETVQSVSTHRQRQLFISKLAKRCANQLTS